MYWRNSNFQIVHFIAGKCHTVDEAYRKLCELREDRDIAIKSAESTRLRGKAKMLRAKAVLESASTEADRLEAKADLSELEALAAQGSAVYEQGIMERDFIDKCIAEIEPLRKYRHLPDHEAHQACQHEEWKLELIHRAETFLLTTGTIPQDQLSAMMSHPEFHGVIAPRIEELSKLGKITTANLSGGNEVLPLLTGPKE